jgi:hypothetical protein
MTYATGLNVLIAVAGRQKVIGAMRGTRLIALTAANQRRNQNQKKTIIMWKDGNDETRD